MYISKRSSYRSQQMKQRFILYGLVAAVGLVIMGFILSFGLFAWYARDLPSPGKLAQDTGASTVFYDRNDKILFEMYKDKNRLPVGFDDISPWLKKATVSIEDKDFYKHSGISEIGILRSFAYLLLRGHISGGGSTITQQLIKNVLLNSNQTASRKIKEIILAMEVERRYTKDQILEMYLNEAPYGGSFWGVGSAAKGYFNKDPKDLNLLESAILAGLPQNPTNYSPYIGTKDAWRSRGKDVLRRMREDKYITPDQEKKTLVDLEKYKFSPPKLAIQAPHFVFYVRDLVDNQFGQKIVQNGAKIKTTLDLEVQKTAEKILHDEIVKLKDYHVTNGGAVVLDSQTGEILAMVGSYDFNDTNFGKFNVATALRQPGSSVKPITYSVAFDKGYTAATPLMDVKTVFPVVGGKDYVPVNYDGKFHGPVQLRFALANSINIPAVKLVAMVGIKDFMQRAYDMGLDTFEPTADNMKRFGLSITLGGGESTLLDMTSAYTVFASGGIKRKTSALVDITDYDGKSIYKQVRSPEKRVISPEVSFIVSHILSDNIARSMEFGTNSYLNVAGKTVAVKTGTTDDKRDNWTIGYTKNITVGVWVGNNDNSPMNQQIASGITGASPIWHDIMVALLKTHKDGIMDKPDNVKALQVDSFLGGLHKDGYPDRTEYFISGTEPKDISPFYKKLKISKANGKLANDIEIKNNNYDEKEFIIISESDPVSTDGKNRWQEGIDQWEKDQGDSKYHPPTEVSDVSSDSIVVSIKSPSNQVTLNSGNNLTISAKITSLYSIKNVKIYINGNEIKSIDGDNKNIDYTTNLGDGTYELRISAQNEKGSGGESSIRFGINKPWEEPTPTPTGVSTPTPTPTP